MRERWFDEDDPDEKYNEDWDDNEDFYGDQEDYRWRDDPEDTCGICGRADSVDCCQQCGLPLCARCSELGLGFCHDHPDKDYHPDGYRSGLRGLWIHLWERVHKWQYNRRERAHSVLTSSEMDLPF